MEELQVLCHDGRLSFAKLRELQSGYAQTVEFGLEYKTIRYAIVQARPPILGLCAISIQPYAQCRSDRDLLSNVSQSTR